MINRRTVASALLATPIFPVLTTPANAQSLGTTPTREHENMLALLERYEAALNASDTDAIIALYAPDGVFMPAFSPSAVGAGAVRQAYNAVFEAIRLSVKFDIVEVVQVAPEWAFARTNSAGTVTVNATDATVTEANQELFVLQKDAQGFWKIARYSFSPTKPPRA